MRFSWFRVVLPFDQLRAHGWDVRYAAGTPAPEASSFKILLGERLMFPEVLGDWRRRRARHRLVYEVDDDLWSVDPVNSLAYRAFSRHSILDAVGMAITIADIVTVTTDYLAEAVRKHTGHREVRVVPNFIQERLLTMERPRRSHVTIGWQGGASHGLDLAQVAEPVRKVLDADRSLRLHLIGNDFRPTFGVMSFARYTPWEPEPADLYPHIDFDIGLAPVTPTEFNLSKSSLKCLEYSALGIPVIASDFAPYQGFVIDGVTGFLVRTPKQWRERLRELVNDSDLRESMGAKARELAAQHTIEGNWDKWAAVFEELG